MLRMFCAVLITLHNLIFKCARLRCDVFFCSVCCMLLSIWHQMKWASIKAPPGPADMQSVGFGTWNQNLSPTKFPSKPPFVPTPPSPHGDLVLQAEERLAGRRAGLSPSNLCCYYSRAEFTVMGNSNEYFATWHCIHFILWRRYNSY